jgi:hypothetical protein
MMDWIDFENGKIYDTYEELSKVRKEREDNKIKGGE